MNIANLKEIFEIEKIPKDLYSLKGGLPNERFCIEKVNNQWTVYYSERGRKSDLKLFDTEEKACLHLYKRVRECLSVSKKGKV